MFGIGSTELLLILVVALIVLGPKSLAGVSRTLGKAMGEFRRVSTEFQRTLNMEAAQQEAREAKNGKSAQSQQKQAAPEVSPHVPEDSPIGQALAKARADAAKDTQVQANDDSRSA